MLRSPLRQFENGNEETANVVVGPEEINYFVHGHYQSENVAQNSRQENNVAGFAVQFLVEQNSNSQAQV